MKPLSTLLTILAAAIGFAQTPSDVLKAVNDKLAAADTLQATMSVTFPRGTPQVWKVELMKPNLYKIITPDQQFRSDGKAELTYLSLAKRYQYSERTGAQITDAPFLFGLNAFFVGFLPLPALGGSETTLDGKKAFAVNIQEPGFTGPTVLYVDLTSGLPLGYDEPMAAQSLLKVRYLDTKLNATVDSKSFSWTPPDGAKSMATQDLESRMLKPGVDAPAPAVKDMKGSTVDLSAQYTAYRSTLVYFWNGAPPYADLASLTQLSTGLAGQRFQILIVDSNATPDSINAKLTGVAVPFTVIVDADGSLAKAYGVSSTSEYIVGSDGKIGSHFLGYDPDGIAKALRQRGFRV
ncbi:MAG TPA: redoxin domain-containing protein [Fimbriimonadaceae bacterium]|jgi:outer membrane lipoprotein-sorting protein/peroxiredoxin